MTKSQLWHFRTTTEGKERSDATSLGESKMTKSQLWHFRTTTEGKERSDATSLGVSEVTKSVDFGTSERLVPRSRSAEGRREATSVLLYLAKLA